MLKVLVKFKDKVLNNIETDQSEITIGRNKDNHIVIDNLGVSKQHAKIKRHLDGYAIEDLNSTNGTLLNEKKVGFAKLSDKDTVTIGKHRLEIYYSNKKDDNTAQPVADDTIKI